MIRETGGKDLSHWVHQGHLRGAFGQAPWVHVKVGDSISAPLTLNLLQKISQLFLPIIVFAQGTCNLLWSPFSPALATLPLQLHFLLFLTDPDLPATVGWDGFLGTQALTVLLGGRCTLTERTACHINRSGGAEGSGLSAET